MKSNRFLVGGVALAATFAATPTYAGPSAGDSVASTPVVNNGDWCDFLKSTPGTLYKDKSNPFIQGVKVFGRAHYQAVHVDGTVGSETIQDFRRLRAGAQIDFLKYFKLKGEVNLVDDDRQVGRDLGFGYETIQEAHLTFNAGKAFNLGYFDSAKVSFGKQKLAIGGEQRTSSKKIKTLERSAISNRLRNGNDGTGLKLSAKKGAWAGSLGYFSNERVEELSYDFNSDGGTYFWAHTSYDLSETDTVHLDYLQTNSFESGESAISADYAFVASYEMDRGPYNFLLEGIYGENNGSGARGGNFYGLVLLPSYQLNDNVELVLRYQYQGSNADEGVRVNSRYTRRSGNSNTSSQIGANRGDSHHSIYAGVNYFLCGHNAKVLLGVQYDNIDTPTQGKNEAVTIGGAFRMFF